MNILFFSHYFPPEVNAPATRTYEHCVRWAKAGHDVTVVTCVPNCPDGLVYPGSPSSLPTPTGERAWFTFRTKDAHPRDWSRAL
jgi:hypothetical protein